MANVQKSNRVQLPLKARVTCPHCWNLFPPGDVLWVSAHPDLQGDERLGKETQQRFLPTRFTVRGEAIDVKGEICRQLACPNCHLIVSRALVEMTPLFISILGAPASGKSNLLAAMTWKMRTTLGQAFGINFVDSDPGANQVLNRYEEILFKNPKPDSLVRLRKTEPEAGELYDSVYDKGRAVLYPKPFVFSLLPDPARIDDPDEFKRLTRAMCLYDNAGENFMPGSDQGGLLVTKHLALSSALLFLFDPTQHYLFRDACQGKSNDPQLGEFGKVHPQEGVIAEAANRIKTQKGLSQQERCRQPLVVVVTKYDAWSALTKNAVLDLGKLVKPRADGRSGLDVGSLKSLSDQVRHVLMKYASEVVSAAEGNFEDVTYVPVSALGTTPEIDPESGQLVVRPRNVKPQFAEVPLLYALHRAVEGLVPSVSRETRAQAAVGSSTQKRYAANKSSLHPSAPPGSNGKPGEQKTVSAQAAETQNLPEQPPAKSPKETYLKETDL